MADKPSHRAATSLGVLGAIATIVSVWWFAFRPRRGDGPELGGEPDGAEGDATAGE